VLLTPWFVKQSGGCDKEIARGFFKKLKYDIGNQR
jgi:hypothetical protein